jgi:phosphatidylglycerol:prolipoprotein diacylglycerol transferase
MHPIICTLGPFTIYSYGLLLAIGFLVASVLGCLEAKRQGINPDLIFNFCFIVFISGVIGARIFYIVDNVSYYIKNPLDIIMLQYGGLSWFGGLGLGVLSGVIYLKKKHLRVYKIFDLIVPFVALAQSLGRTGCLLNGCCFGRISRFGIYFEVHDAILVPTQLYSSLILIGIFVVLRALQDKPHKIGEIFYTYLLLYSLKRFFIEFWRADNPVIFLGVTLFQVLSISIFFLSLIKLILIKRSKTEK